MNRTGVSRREVIAAAALAATPAAAAPVDYAVIKRHDEGVESYLKNQVTDRKSRWFGRFPDAFGLHQPGGAAGAYTVYTAAFLHPNSRFHKSPILMERIRLSADSLKAAQNEYGNFDLLITNFNSPPDTAFITRSAATGALLAKRAGEKDIFALMEPTLIKGGVGLVNGGMHTPNHRWVACAGLAQLHELFGKPEYVKRIDQWLAETIDIDVDGQFSERSTLGYNAHVCNSLVTVAHKLNRPALLEPVRRNLESMLYLLEPGFEVITDISRRQDQYTHGKPEQSWFALRYMANKDGNGQFAAIADLLTPGLPTLMEYPELNEPGPERKPAPDNYDKLFPSGEYAHIRRGNRSIALLLGGYDRFLSVRNGAAQIHAIRMASAFFGRGQFVPAKAGKRSNGEYFFEQEMDAGYYQPLNPAEKVPAGEKEFYSFRPKRKRTEVCEMKYVAVATETPAGLRLRLQASGTRDVPVAIEINLRDEGKLSGCVEAPGASNAWLLPSGSATLEVGGDRIRFGPGIGEHRYTQVRGARPKLDGRSVYLCGYAPFDHTIEFEFL